MRVIVTYVSVGAGHFKAAEAIYNYLKQNYKELDVKLVDALSQTNFLFRYIYSYGYILLVKYAPLLWGLAFWVTYSKCLSNISRFCASLLYLFSAKRFACLLIKENPDFIVSSHFLTSHIGVNLKIAGRLNSKIVSIITDFGVHPFWVIKGTDMYIAASDFTRNRLMLQGVKEEDIRVTGIPVEERFVRAQLSEAACHCEEAAEGSRRSNHGFEIASLPSVARNDYRGKLLQRFGLKEDKFTVLIVTGSFGIGPIEDIIRVLQGQDIRILVVCARNKRLYEKLVRKNYPDCSVFGFIENIEELMALSNVIITKPGGLSISESLAMDLFPIFISPIPGQETENIKALAYYGIGIRPKAIAEIKDIVIDLKLHPDKLGKFKEAAGKVKKPFSARQVCDAIFESSGRASC